MKRLTSLLLCVVMVFAACSHKKAPEKPAEKPVQTQVPEEPKQEKPEQETEESQMPVEQTPEIVVPEDVDLELLGTQVIFQEDQAEAFIKEVSAIDVEYELYDLVDFEQALQQYATLPEGNYPEPQLIKNGALDESAFREQVTRNTEAYLSEYTGNRYSAMTDTQFDRSIKNICKGVAYLLESGVDPARLDAVLSAVSVVSYHDHGRGMVVSKEVIYGLNFDVIPRETSANGVDLEEHTALHEAIHLGQRDSRPRIEEAGAETMLGPCCSWEHLPTDPLDWTWYMEGSAEWLAMDCSGRDEPSVYESYIKDLESVCVASMLTKDELDFCKTTLLPDIQTLYDYFGVQTEREQLEMVQMMYALDVALTKKAELFDAYKKTYGTSLPDNINHGYRLHASAALTLSKLFYRDLACQLQSGLTLQDVFSMIAVFEVEMSRMTKFYSVPKQNTAFVEGYCAIQNSFMELLAAQTGVTAQDLQGQYTAWFYALDDMPLAISCLPQETVQWLQAILETRSDNKRKTVMEAMS